MRFKRVIACVFLMAICLSSQAQNRLWTFAVDTWNYFAGPKSYLDSVWIYQPKNTLNLSVSYKGKWNNVELSTPELNYKLADKTIHSIGLYGSYGPITLGYSMKLGKKDKKGQSLSLNWLSSFYGLQFYHTHMLDDMVKPLESSTSVRLISLDGYFAFNRKRFSYLSAYRGKLIQRRSAGSVVAAAKYMHGRYTMEGMTEYPSYTSHQFILGAGYSFNIVPYHRDPCSSAGLGGLRNLTINLTAIPMANLVSIMNVTHHTETGDEIMPLKGVVLPGFLGRFAVSYTIEHVYICASFDYNFNRFKNSNGAMYGNLDNWCGGFEIHYRF